MQGSRARLVVYIAAAPGAGKTRRLLQDARRLHDAGRRVLVAPMDTKGDRDLERLRESLESLPIFDLDEVLDAKPHIVVLDDLAPHWRAVLRLREAGVGVLGAFDIAHLETVRPEAEALLGTTIAASVPMSFLRAANEVVAIDASPGLLQRRMRGKAEVLPEATLVKLREHLLRTIDELTIPTTAPATASTAVALVPEAVDPTLFLARSAPIALALDLALEILPDPHVDLRQVEQLATTHGADVLPSDGVHEVDITTLRASMICVPSGTIARRIVNMPVDRDIFVVDASQSYLEAGGLTTPLAGTIGDRMRVGYGKLSVYLGAAAGAGTTYAMLDRAQQLAADGRDVVIGSVDTRGRAETEAFVGALDRIAPKRLETDGTTHYEMDRDAILARMPHVVVVDDLAHANAPGSLASKRYLDVLAFLRAGIDVLTTLNVQHLEALSDAIERLTGTIETETLPDGILPLADEVILIDVTPQTLLDRGSPFPLDALAALRELAIRETLRAKTRQRLSAPFGRLLVSVVSREEDLHLIRKASRLAARMEVDFAIAHVAERRDKVDEAWVAEFARVGRALNADFIDRRGANDASAGLLEVARSVPETVVAVGGTHRRPRWPAKNAFARRLLDGGARELLVLARSRALHSEEHEHA